MEQWQADEEFMALALNAARDAAALDEVPVGAVIVRDGRLVAAGINRREIDQDATGHAEMAAIRAATEKLGSWRLENCDLYVTLEPCMMCAGAIIQARLRRVVFGAYDPKSGMAGSISNLFLLPGNHRVDVTGGVLAEEAGALLSDFFRKKRQRSVVFDNQRGKGQNENGA